uniref:Uncharacterized protein n=1 Tax=Moniliophthora roreri TaxID=221103 RepID=A0A0W0FNK9_MONRR
MVIFNINHLDYH